MLGNLAGSWNLAWCTAFGHCPNLVPVWDLAGASTLSREGYWLEAACRITLRPTGPGVQLGRQAELLVLLGEHSEAERLLEEGDANEGSADMLGLK